MASEFTWGINAHPNRPSALSITQQVDLAERIGMTSLRVDIYDSSATTIAYLSSLITAAESRGITVLPVIVPAAAAMTSEASARAWGLKVGSALATAFPSLTWEAGNEMDMSVIIPGKTGESTADYDTGRYTLARGAISGLVDGINSADPSAQVAVGIAGIHFGFLQRLASDGVRWDITSEHYYAYPGATDTMVGADQLFAKLAEFGRPIVMTEFNQQQGSFLAPSEQTATLVSMMDAMTTLAPKYNIVGAYIYELLDETQLTGPEAHFGLAGADGVLSGSGLAVQDYLGQTDIPPTARALTAHLARDTGTSATDSITSSAALTGTAEPNSVLHFTVDGIAAASVTVEASGSWSWSPTGLADGFHAIAASGSAGSLGITLDTKAPVPVFTNATLANGIATLTGTTGSAGDTVTLYDGNTLIGTTTSSSSGGWSFTGSVPASVVHSLRVEGADLAGNTGRGGDVMGLGTGAADTLRGGSGNDWLFGAGGNDTLKGAGGADHLSGGAGRDTFTYSAASESTSSAPDTIIDFQHGSDSIDFTNIAGIFTTNGAPRFQGQLSAAGNQTLNPHSIAYIDVGGNTHLLVNTSNTADIVSSTDTRAAEMVIDLIGNHLGLSSTDFHHG